MKFNKILIAVMLSTLVSTAASGGNTGQSHDNESMSAQSMTQEAMSHDSMNSEMTQNKMFLEKKDIDGYTVSFHVMKAVNRH